MGNPTPTKESPLRRDLVLVVDDAQDVREMLMGHLASVDFDVLGAANAVEMRGVLRNRRPRLVLLDAGLPDADGVALAREMRLAERCCLIFVTADAGRELEGLEAGGDDYIIKPIDLAIVDARIRNALRRSPDPRIRFDGWRLDVIRRELFRPDGTMQGLTAGEMNILAALAANSPEPLSRDFLLDVISNRDPRNVSGHTVDNLIVRLRRKLTNGGRKGPIVTIRGTGYALRPQTDE